MSERCFVRVKWDPATTAGDARRAVGGFLRYIQHRDLHPGSKPARTPADVRGLVKYVAYRDRASTRAELFGPDGVVGTRLRKDFADYVTRSIERSRPQLYRSRDGRLLDRRRAVSRFVISPERAVGLDLQQLTWVAVARLESELGVDGLRWIAAVHRNTQHHHVHLVLAGVHEEAPSRFRRVDISKKSLAAIKDAFALEISRQRADRSPQVASRPDAAGAAVRHPLPDAAAVTDLRAIPLPAPVDRPLRPSMAPMSSGHGFSLDLSVLRLRAAARRYQRRMQRAAELEARRLGWEHAA